MALTQFHRSGLTFDVRDEGPAGGVPVILLHGFPQDATSYDRVLPHLHEAGLRTLVPDQRGYSAGARPPGRSAYRMTELVGDVLALQDHAGLQTAHVVGHDWGGGVAWALAAAHPDRVETLTVLSTPHPAALVRSMLHSGQALKSWYMGFFQLPVLPEVLARRSLPRSLRRSGLPQPDVDHYVRRMAEPGALSGALGWYRAMPLAPAAAVPAVAVPTSYVWGSRDFALGRTAAVMTAGFVTGTYRFVELPAGHWLPETRPQEVADLVIERVRLAR